MGILIRIPIRYKLLTSSLLVTTAVVSIITFTMANLFHTDKKAYIHDLTSTVAEHTAQQTNKLLIGYKERLKLFARFILDRDMKQDSKLRLLKDMFQDFPDIIAVTLIDEKQKEVMIYDSNALESVGASKMDLRIFRIANPLPLEDVLSDHDYVENSTLQDGRPTLTLAIAYYRTNHPPVVIYGVISMERLIKNISHSKAFESFIVDRKGKLFSHINGQALIDRNVLDWLPPVSEVTAVGGINVTREYVKEGKEYIGGFAPVGLADLVAVSQIPKEVAFLTARELLGNLTGISLLLLVGSAIISLLLAYRITKPIELLSNVTARVKGGDFNIEIEKHSHDEIGNLADSFRDMAQGLREREQKLHDANIALIQSEKLSAFGQLSAGIAHEVKNPLTGILGYAQLSKRKVDKDDVLYKNLEVIENETKRCRDIIDNLMRFARCEKVERVSMNLNDVIYDAARIVNHQLSLNNVRVKGNMGKSLPNILGNPNQLQQVFMNLMINAQQAMGDQGGQIDIETRNLSKQRVLVTFKDNGPGIPEEIRGKIFEPFFTTKKAGQGTGLGLSVSYGIINDHGGTITVDNNADHGALFSITLPIGADSNTNGRNATDEGEPTPKTSEAEIHDSGSEPLDIAI